MGEREKESNEANVLPTHTTILLTITDCIHTNGVIVVRVTDYILYSPKIHSKDRESTEYSVCLGRLKIGSKLQGMCTAVSIPLGCAPFSWALGQARAQYYVYSVYYGIHSAINYYGIVLPKLRSTPYLSTEGVAAPGVRARGS